MEPRLKLYATQHAITLATAEKLFLLPEKVSPVDSMTSNIASDNVKNTVQYRVFK